MYSNILLIICSIIVLLLITDPVLSKERDLVKDNIVIIERVASKYARVAKVNVRKIDSMLSISGTLRKRSSFGRGPVPGHIDVNIIEPGGLVFSKNNVSYTRRSTLSRVSRFKLKIKLNVVLASGSIVRVIHHVAFRHDSRYGFGVEVP